MVSDKEFVYLSTTKERIMDTMKSFVIMKATDEDCFPDLKGYVYFLVVSGLSEKPSLTLHNCQKNTYWNKSGWNTIG